MPQHTSAFDSTSLKSSVRGKEGIEGAEKFIQDLDEDSPLPSPPKLTPEEEKKLYRKIDWRLMPILTLMYLCSFLDRGQCIVVNS